MGPEQLLKKFSGQDIRNGVDRQSVPMMQRDIKRNGMYIFEHFTDWEIVYCEQGTNPLLRAQRYAGRFAAKEAVTKALGLNGLGVNFQEISILPDKKGRPYVCLSGNVSMHAEALGIIDISISITRNKYTAWAWCIAVLGGNKQQS